MTAGWPRRDDRTGAIILAIMSLGDPAVYGRITLTGLSG